MSEIRNLTRNGETFYPLTCTDAIVNRDGDYGIDDEPIAGSENLVKSDGIFKTLINLDIIDDVNDVDSITSTETDASLMGIKTDFSDITGLIPSQNAIFVFGPEIKQDCYVHSLILPSIVVASEVDIYTCYIHNLNNTDINLDYKCKGKFNIISKENYKVINFPTPIYVKTGQFFAMAKMCWTSSSSYYYNIATGFVTIPEGSNYGQITLPGCSRLITAKFHIIYSRSIQSLSKSYKSTLNDITLFGKITDIAKTNIASASLAWPIADTCRKDILLRRLILDVPNDVRMVSIYTCRLTRNGANTTIDYSYKGDYIVLNNGNVKYAWIADPVKVSAGERIAISSAPYSPSKTVVYNEGGTDNTFIAFENSRADGQVSLTSRNLIGTSMHLEYEELIDVQENGVSEAFFGMLEKTSTKTNSSLIGSLTTYGTNQAPANIFVYGPAFRSDCLIDSISIPKTYTRTSIPVYLCNISIENNQAIVDYDFAGIHEIITDVEDCKVVFSTPLQCKRGQYLAMPYMPFSPSNKIQINPTGSSNQLIALPSDLTEKANSGRRVHDQQFILGYAMHINYYVMPQDEEVSIMLFGNSLTQDAAEYLPWMLHTIYPNLKFRILNYYRGAATLAQLAQQVVNNFPDHLHISTSEHLAWQEITNTSDKLAAVNGMKHVTIAEFTHAIETFDLTSGIALIENLREKCGNNTQFHWLIDKTRTENYTIDQTEYARAKSFAKTAWENLPISSILDPGVAYMMALGNSTLYNVMSSDPTYTDPTHAEGGLPCYVEAVNVAAWVCDKILNKGASILDNRLDLTSAVYDTLGIHGDNVGTNGPIFTTLANYKLAQEVALVAYNQIDKIKLGL